MIKINLLKENGPQKSVRTFPFKTILIVLFSLVFVAAIIGIVFKTMGNRPKEPAVALVEKNDTVPVPADTLKAVHPSVAPAPNVKPQAAGPVNEPAKSPMVPESAQTIPVEKNPKRVKVPIQSAPEKQASAEFSPATSKNNYAPSTHASDKVIEDVVREKARRSGTDFVSLTYKEMSHGEKINYEIAFTRKIFELLTHAVPEGIEFNSLTIDSFSVIKAVGLGRSRELVSDLFSSLRWKKTWFCVDGRFHRSGP